PINFAIKDAYCKPFGVVISDLLGHTYSQPQPKRNAMPRIRSLLP
ncbi:hypothetical protein HYR69_11715, partial [Candidatus Sumerlaeota bacterium]|nr:hypothetical protein [Candidatus Sumerlaeota bacterium]